MRLFGFLAVGAFFSGGRECVNVSDLFVHSRTVASAILSVAGATPVYEDVTTARANRRFLFGRDV
jgi:hypothetical protein